MINALHPAVTVWGREVNIFPPVGTALEMTPAGVEKGHLWPYLESAMFLWMTIPYTPALNNKFQTVRKA